MYRPAVPDSAELPVLYFLHGYPGSASDVFDAALPRLIDRLVAEGYPPFVLAAPDGNGPSHRDTEWANAVDGTDQFETFVTGNVIRAVEGSHLRDRTRRAIAGFSMGGYGAVNLALPIRISMVRSSRSRATSTSTTRRVCSRTNSRRSTRTRRSSI